MSNPGIPTFDQLTIFLAIVDTGSFAGAARQLNRAVSVISYGIANLEAQLGLELFEREGTRKPRLTVAGRALLAEARAISHGVDGLRAKVKGLLDGLEAEVDLAVDVMLPTERLGNVLREFAETNSRPCSCVCIWRRLGAVTAMVLDGKAMIGDFRTARARAWRAIEMRRRRFGGDGAGGGSRSSPRAHGAHPARRRARAYAAGADGSLALHRGARFLGDQPAHLASRRSRRQACACCARAIGWGNMPLPMIAGDLASGALVRLAMPDHPGGIYRFAGIWRRDAPPGPAAAWLLERFVALGEADLPVEGLSDI